ncbi:hypothetical protein RB201_10145 [Streptomyces sp. S1A(2023)]
MIFSAAARWCFVGVEDRRVVDGATIRAALVRRSRIVTLEEQDEYLFDGHLVRLERHLYGLDEFLRVVPGALVGRIVGRGAVVSCVARDT